MLIELSIAGVIVLNVIAWLVIQLGLAWSVTQLAPVRFDPRSRLARTRAWEDDGRVYERVFAIRLWKGRLPDASPMFRKGFAKAMRQSASPAYLERFLRETWRGEIVHWLALLAIPVFFVWNPPWAVGVNAAVALAVNGPCILALRYNRARFQRVLAARFADGASDRSHHGPPRLPEPGKPAC